MISIGKHAPSARLLPIDRARHPDRQTLHTARERTPIRSFCEQVQVISLHRKMDEPKPEPLFPRRQRSPHRAKGFSLTQRREPRAHAQRHMIRVPLRKCWPAQMRHPSALAIRAAAGPRARATPGAKAKPQLR
jgi:hypothetical protein